MVMFPQLDDGCGRSMEQSMFFGPMLRRKAEDAAEISTVKSGRFTVVTTSAQSKLFKPFRDGSMGDELTPSTASTITKDPWADVDRAAQSLATPSAAGDRASLPALAKPFRADLEDKRHCKERCAYFLPY